MNDRWLALKAAIRELLHPTPVDDEPDATTAEGIARWVDLHRTCSCWARDPKPGPWHFERCKHYRGREVV
jgi:hypothetical protein